MAIKLIEVKEPEVPGYTRGVLAGLEAGFRLGLLVAYHYEGDDHKKISRLLTEVTGGRNYDALTIKSSLS